MDMDPALHEALRNVSASFLAGRREASKRNSLKKVSGLQAFGAAMMMGAALLSPVNSAMANIHPAQPQRTEQTQEVVAQDQDINLFEIEVDGRTWNNAGAERYRAYDVRSWVMDGQLVYNDIPANQQDVARQSLEAQAIVDYANEMANRMELEPGSPQAQAAVRGFVSSIRQDLSEQGSRAGLEGAILAAHARATVARQGADALSQQGLQAYDQAIEAGMDTLGYEAPSNWQPTPSGPVLTSNQKWHMRQHESYSSWSPKTDRYQQESRYQTEDPYSATGKEAQRWESFANTLVGHAYSEISQGHSVENPSARLLDVCRQVQKAEADMPGFNTHPYSDMVFETCNAEGMSMAIRLDTLKKYSVGAGVVVGTLALKGMGLAAQLAGGAMLYDQATSVSLADRRRKRSEGLGQDDGPDLGDSPSPMKMG